MELGPQLCFNWFLESNKHKGTVILTQVQYYPMEGGAIKKENEPENLVLN